MATVLCVWELGGNLGHFSNLRLPVEVALGGGHQVVLAARELRNARDVFGDMPLTYLQAPFKQSPAAGANGTFLSYTQLLAHQCFSSADELGMYLRAWRALFALVRPDAVLFEHSPTALVAAHDHTFRKILVGNGFTAPSPMEDPAEPFLPFPTTQRTPEVLGALLQDDAALLACINQALRSVHAPPVSALHAIYNQAHATLRMTWPELDQFGTAPNHRYLGVEPPLPRQPSEWPEGDGPRVFGYLHAIPSLEALLKDLLASGVCALLFVRNLPPELRAHYTGPQMRFVDSPVDLADVARQAAWVINTGNHSTAATFAAAGVPQLIIPLHQEQLFLALRLVAQGSAVMAFQDQTAYSAAIGALQTNAGIRQQARALQAQMSPHAELGARDYIAEVLAQNCP
jgi:hypothetical protein